MCGIFGVVSSNDSVIPTLISGLRKLEYRGYDSSGIAIMNSNGKIEVKKSEGKVENLCKIIEKSNMSDGMIGIAHTRWATHGVPNLKNAHPIYINGVAIVHNGIVENFNLLKIKLEERGIQFYTDTDTEVIPNILTLYLSEGLSHVESLFKCLSDLHGSFALVLLFAEYKALFAAKRNLPLVIGYSHNAVFVTSDSNTLNRLVDKISHLEDNDIAVIKFNEVNIYNDGIQVERSIKANNSSNNFLISKNGYPSFMLKEIFEQPYVLRKTVNYSYKECIKMMSVNKKIFYELNDIIVVGCGSSHFAGLIAKYWLESIAKVRVYLGISSEFRYSNTKLERGDIGLFISQSGETADTIGALHYAKSQGLISISLTNTFNSSIERISDFVLHTFAGPEIGVASTKTFSTQLVTLACFTLELGRMKYILNKERINQLSNTISYIPEYVEYALNKMMKRIERISNSILEYTNIILIGRGSSYGVAMEGALKIKELLYVNAIGIAAGEMKHGSIALIDSSVLVIAITPYNNLFFKTLSNIREVVARNGKVIAFSDKQGVPFLKEICKEVVQLPEVDSFVSPIIYSVAMQFLAYTAATKKKLDPDYPRNLAKSVTVE